MTPKQCRLEGAHCLEMAKWADSDGDKILLLRLAEGWRRLAEHRELQPTNDHPVHGLPPDEELKNFHQTGAATAGAVARAGWCRQRAADCKALSEYVPNNRARAMQEDMAARYDAPCRA